MSSTMNRMGYLLPVRRRCRGIGPGVWLLTLCLATACGTGSNQPRVPEPEPATAGAQARPPEQTARPAADEVAKAVASTLDEWLSERLAATEVPGAAAVVVGRDAVVSERVYGVTDMGATLRIRALSGLLSDSGSFGLQRVTSDCEVWHPTYLAPLTIYLSNRSSRSDRLNFVSLRIFERRPGPIVSPE